VLFRSDTGTPLSVVSDSYCIVQPKEVIEFYRDLVADSAFSLETAGALDEGRKVWGLARSNKSFEVKEKGQVDAFLLLASSCDKTLATTVAFTSIRVVCQNTLCFAMDDIKGNAPTKYLKVYHDRHFDWDEAKKKLKLIDTAGGAFTEKIRLLAARKVDEGDVSIYFNGLFLTEKKDKTDNTLSRSALMEIQNLRSALRNGPGQQEPNANGTAWGLVNAVTYYVDHIRRSNNQAQRLDSAWFGAGALLKDKAWDSAIAMHPKVA
jgi:phage/plasmid-like protein (TIGR03299 family)